MRKKKGKKKNVSSDEEEDIHEITNNIKLNLHSILYFFNNHKKQNRKRNKCNI